MPNSKAWPMQISVGQTPADDIEECYLFQIRTKLTPSELMENEGKLAREAIEKIDGFMCFPAGAMILAVEPVHPEYEEDDVSREGKLCYADIDLAEGSNTIVVREFIRLIELGEFKAQVVNEVGPGGWPIVRISGQFSALRKLLSELGYGNEVAISA